jgi:toxin YoeB
VKLVFDPHFLEDLQFWVETDRKTPLKILGLMEEISRTPTAGTGKPERLKHLGGNVWSRRINHADRLVYELQRDEIAFLQCRYHY